MSQTLKAAILVVSTTASQDPTTDAAGNALRSVFDEDGASRWKVVESKIVPDSVALIQRQLMLWTDTADPVNLIVTTGGTGFAVSDQTPEAVSALLHKQAPGLVHGMLAASLSVTPFAMMSRPVAGVRNGTLLITLPGSPKGAKENLQAVIKLLPHACIQAAGADSRSIHSGGVEKLEKDAGVGRASGHSHSHGHTHAHSHGQGHSHSHGHDHGHGALVRHTNPNDNPLSNDPSLGPTRRHRESPYTMLSVEDALALIHDHTPAPVVVSAKTDTALVGATLAEDVKATENVPAFRASIVDGYAVVVPKDGNMKGIFPVTAVSHAAPGEAKELKEGQIARITTGAPLPPGATSVIMVEDTVLKSRTEDGEEEKEVEILAGDVKTGENVREVGSDVKKGSVILQKGEQVSAVGGEIGLMAAVGASQVQIYHRPVVGVLSTGDEIINHDRPGALRLGEVRDTNRPTLLSAVRDWGYEVIDLGIASDKPGTLEETLRDGMRRADLIITTGGVSMGELDLLKPTIERSLGGTIHFGRVNMKPGKPTTFATVPAKNNEGERVSKVIFSLPGNPASALVTFHLFVLPSLHAMSGISPAGLSRVPVTLSHDFNLDPGRPEYHRAIIGLYVIDRNLRMEVDMCHFDYRKFDSCGDYGIEISRICDDALWRAGIEGELRICVPRILERSLEWSGLDHHEPPKPALFRGYDGYCEMCAARFKLPGSILQRSYSDYELDYSRPLNSFNPDDFAPYLSFRGFIAKIPELLGIADQFSAAHMKQGPFMVFQKSLEQCTWSQLRKALPFTYKGEFENGCTLGVQSALERLNISDGITKYDRDQVFHAMQHEPHLRVVYNTLFKPRGMPLGYFGTVIVDGCRKARHQLWTPKAEVVRNSVRQDSDCSDDSALTTLTRTPELSDVDLAAPKSPTQVPEFLVATSYDGSTPSHPRPDDRQVLHANRGGQHAAAIKLALSAISPSPTAKRSSDVTNKTRDSVTQVMATGHRPYQLNQDGIEMATAQKCAVVGLGSRNAAYSDLNTLTTDASATLADHSRAAKVGEKRKSEFEQQPAPQQKRQRLDSWKGPGDGNLSQIPYYKADRAFKWKVFERPAYERTHGASGAGVTREQHALVQQPQDVQQSQNTQQPSAERRSSRAQGQVPQYVESVFIPDDSDEEMKEQEPGQNAAQSPTHLDPSTVRRLQNSGLLGRSRRR
ncbi:hypothetical protein J7T55_012630 [Diaporthe amygdali]|uniref:uncharacterized protein n=1 Tax=Phomopsis amygdali TaxID=1214568 RepID=UPI0022FE76CC|nr:uncharacterized protein J7T55_012630 [Diaporthe amygdali]KAJ0115352.1 hypothetical protein J7T55_012630 [Diaporthe amygdali]